MMRTQLKPIGKRGPRLIIWLVTSKCNLACRHCYTAGFSGRGELGPNQAQSIVKSAAEAGVKHIGFSGGEVFLREDALELIGLACELGLSTSVVTNGSMLNQELARQLAEHHVFTILSIDGAVKETHEEIRGRGSWDFILPAVEAMRRFGVRFSAVMAVNKLNYGEVSDYLAFAQGLGALAGCIIPVMPAGRANEELVLQPQQMITVLQAAAQAAESLRFPVSLWCTPFAKLVTKSRYIFANFCRSGEGEIDISPQGDVLLCDILDIVLSNVEQKGILGAWKEQEEHSVVKSLSNPKLSEPCLDCPLRRKCKGGCFARAALMDGDLYALDPLCPRVTKVL